MSIITQETISNIQKATIQEKIIFLVNESNMYDLHSYLHNKNMFQVKTNKMKKRIILCHYFPSIYSMKIQNPIYLDGVLNVFSVRIVIFVCLMFVQAKPLSNNLMSTLFQRLESYQFLLLLLKVVSFLRSSSSTCKQ